jgi:hypothetical protein
VEVFYLIRAKKMTDKVGLESFWDFYNFWIVNESDCGSAEKFVGT